MEVAILDYETEKVVLKPIPEDVDDIDTYLEEVYNYDMNIVEWMCSEKHIEIVDAR